MKFRMDEGGLAFPRAGTLGRDGLFSDPPESGMTKREWYAGQALPAVVQDAYIFVKDNPGEFDSDTVNSAIAVKAVQIAAAMIAELRR